MALEGMTVKQTMKLKILELSYGLIHSNVAGTPSRKKEMFNQCGAGCSKHGYR